MADVYIPAERVAELIAQDTSAPIWLLIDPRVGTQVDWDHIRAVTERMRHRVARGDELDDLVDHLGAELERHSVVQVFTSRPRTPFGFETSTV